MQVGTCSLLRFSVVHLRRDICESGPLTRIPLMWPFKKKIVFCLQMDCDNQLLEILGGKMSPVIWAELLRRECPSMILHGARLPIGELYCGTLLTVLTACADLSHQSWSSVGQTLDYDHYLYFLPWQALGTNFEECFSSPCNGFKLLLLCTANPLVTTYPWLLTISGMPCVFSRCGDGWTYWRAAWGQSGRSFSSFALE